MVKFHINDMEELIHWVKTYLKYGMEKMEKMTSKQCSKMNYLQTLAVEKIKVEAVLYSFKEFCQTL
jgi:hypothetical protein